ncbi:carbamoyltransferase N-terminal domain-containing protein [Nocardia takedensis]
MSELVFGICAFTHDSSAALLHGTQFIGFLEEDRLSGDKHTRAFPTLAIDALLDAAGAERRDVDVVAYTFDSQLYSHGRESAAARPGPAERKLAALASYDAVWLQHHQTLARLAKEFPRATVVEVAHHEAHAYSALAPAGWTQADVLVIDSIGEGATTSRGRWDLGSRTLEMSAIAVDTDSLGYLYGAVTALLGFRMRDEEGTVMALELLTGSPEWR